MRESLACVTMFLKSGAGPAVGLRPLSDGPQGYTPPTPALPPGLPAQSTYQARAFWLDQLQKERRAPSSK